MNSRPVIALLFLLLGATLIVSISTLGHLVRMEDQPVRVEAADVVPPPVLVLRDRRDPNQPRPLYFIPAEDIDLIDWYAAFAMMAIRCQEYKVSSRECASKAWEQARDMMEGRRYMRQALKVDELKMKELDNGKE